MQVFVNIYLVGCFYSENYAWHPTQGISALRAPFLPRSQLLPKTRGNMSHPFTLCRGVSFQKRSKPCCTTKSWAHPHFLGVGPSHWSEPFTAFSAQCMPTQFTHSRFSPWYSPPTMKYLGTSCGPSQTPVPWELRGPTHVHVVSQDLQRPVAGCPLTCEWEKIQMTFPSHSKSLGWHGFYGTRITTALVINS
jgi:hypothetical protein